MRPRWTRRDVGALMRIMAREIGAEMRGLSELPRAAMATSTRGCVRKMGAGKKVWGRPMAIGWLGEMGGVEACGPSDFNRTVGRG